MMYFTAILLISLSASWISKVHGLGVWLVLMIIHGFLVDAIGSIAIRIPMYAGLIVIFVILAKRQWKGVSDSTLLGVAFLIIGMGLTSIQGIDISRSISEMFNYGKNFALILVLAGTIRSTREIRLLSLYCLGAVTFGALLALHQYFTDSFTVSSVNIQRAGGLRGDPNDTAMLLVIGIPIAVYWIFQSTPPLKRLFFFACMILVFIGIVLTQSRGGFLALLVVMAAIYFYRPTASGAIVACLTLLLMVMLAPESYKERMQTLQSGQEENSRSLEGRSILLIEGSAVFLDNFALGVGPGNFGKAFRRHIYENENGPRTVRGQDSIAAHNMYLQYFVENGVIIGLAFLLVLGRGAIGLLKMKRLKRKVVVAETSYPLGNMLFAGLLGMLVAGLFLSQAKNPVLWFLVGIGYSYYQQKGKNKYKTDGGPNSNAAQNQIGNGM